MAAPNPPVQPDRIVTTAPDEVDLEDYPQVLVSAFDHGQGGEAVAAKQRGHGSQGRVGRHGHTATGPSATDAMLRFFLG